MKTTFTLIACCLLISISNLSATTYTTTTDGNINGSIWAPGTPPLTLPFGDSIVINHSITLNMDLKIYGVMVINSGASLTGAKNIKVGDGYTTGKLINNGTIEVVDIKVKGDNTVANTTAPTLINNGTITLDALHIGDNAGAGILTNNALGSITINGELHLNNLLDNKGTMTVTGFIKNHGGTIDGGGTITNCQIELNDNNGRPGTLLSQNICCNFADDDEPDYKIKSGTTYSELAIFVLPSPTGVGTSSAKHFIHEIDYYSCGVNAAGSPQPVELIDFRVIENRDHYAELSWVTESENNNKHFEVERSLDGRNFAALGVVNGNGNSTALQTYSFIDKFPVSFAYYRLKQVDYDGAFEFSNIITLKMDDFKPKVIDAFPTIAENEITLRFTSLDSRKSLLKVINAFGAIIYEEQIYTTNQLEYRTLDLSEYDHGIYHIVLTDGKEYLTKGFVVQKTY